MDKSSHDNQITFYDKYLSGQPEIINFHQAQRLAKILSAMVTVTEQIQKSNLRICDLGCGVGWLTNVLRVFGDVTGVDWSPTGIRLAKERWPGLNFEATDILNYRPDHAFDVVVSSEVIEHVEDKLLFMETISYLLRNGGFAILTCPNEKMRHHYDNLNPEYQPTEQWLTPKELRNLFSRYMRVEHQETFLFNFSRQGMLRILNSYKLNLVARAFGISGLFNALCSASQYGLYQIIVGKK